LNDPNHYKAQLFFLFLKHSFFLNESFRQIKQKSPTLTTSTRPIFHIKRNVLTRRNIWTSVGSVSHKIQFW
jgi:hypothetical protein